MPIGIHAAAGRRPRATARSDRAFYSGMAILAAAIVFAGYSRTYYLRTYFEGPALTALTTLRIVHGTAFTAWILLFVTQTLLVAAGRTALHRRLGIGGAALAVAMVGLGVAMAVTATLGPPFFFGVVDALVPGCVAYDLATRRTVHPAYTWGGLAVVASQPLRLVIGGTAAWLALASMLSGR